MTTLKENQTNKKYVQSKNEIYLERWRRGLGLGNMSARQAELNRCYLW